MRSESEKAAAATVWVRAPVILAFSFTVLCAAPLAVGQPTTLTLHSDSPCYSPPGGPNTTVTVDVDFAHTTAPVVGGQFFIEYDPNKLDFISMVPGPPPFVRQIVEIVDEPSGFIFYAVGILNTGQGTAADSTMATITFNILREECAVTSQVHFTSGGALDPPTRLSDNNDNEVPAIQVDMTPIAVEEIFPALTPLVISGSDATASCEASVTFATTMTDNCLLHPEDIVVGLTYLGSATFGTPIITKTQIIPGTISVHGTVPMTALSDCPVTVEVEISATDVCGHHATPVSGSAQVTDDQFPVFTTPIVSTTPANGDCEFTATFSTTVTDNCLVDSADVSVVLSTPVGDATLSVVSLTKTQVNPGTVAINATVHVEDVIECPVVVEMFVLAPDKCGNETTIAPTTTHLALAADDTCLDPLGGPNQTIVVRVDLLGSASTVVGGQFFIDYDQTALDFISLVHGDEPFTRQIVSTVNEGIGFIFYAVGIQFTGQGTSADTTMAYITFRTISLGCASTAQVRFTSGGFGDPPTRLSDDHDNEVYAQQVNLTPIAADPEYPVISGFTIQGDTVAASCTGTVTFSATVSDNCEILPNDVDVDITLGGSATFDTPTVTFTQLNPQTIGITGSVVVSALRGCPATVAVNIEAADTCHNAATPANGVGEERDLTRPVVTKPVVSTSAVDSYCQYSATFSATVTDNCFVDTADVTIILTTPVGSAQLDVTSLTRTQVDPQTVHVSGIATVTNVTDCPALLQITVAAVDPCDNLGTNSTTSTLLALASDDACVSSGSGPNQTLVVRVDLLGAETTVVGGQFFIDYDKTKLDFVRMDAGDNPFTREIVESVNESLGFIFYAVGIQFTGHGTSADTTMAYISFRAIGDDCSITSLVRFTSGGELDPPTRLSDDNDDEVTSQEVNLAPVTVDGTAPIISGTAITGDTLTTTCTTASTLTFSATVTDTCSLDAADVTAVVTNLTNNAVIGTPIISITQTGPLSVQVTGSVNVSDVQDCPATVQLLVTASDGCGNLTTSAAVNDVFDGSAPVIATPVLTSTGELDGLCGNIVSFSATVTDNCFIDPDDVTVLVSLPTINALLGTPVITKAQFDPQTVTITGSVLVYDLQNCPATVRVTVDARDDCDSHATPATQTVDIYDTTAPVATVPVVIGGDVNGACSYTVTFSSVVTDNCFVDIQDVTVVVSLPTLNATLGTPAITKVQTTPRLVTISGSVLVSDVQACPATVMVTVDARDDCFNHATAAAGTGDVFDRIAPIVSTPAVSSGTVDLGCSTTLTFSSTVTDNCFVDPADVTVTVTLPTANASLGTPSISKVQTDARTVTVTGSVLVSGVQNCPATVMVTVAARDDCFNHATPAAETGDVNDDIAPVTSTPVVVGGDVDGACGYYATFSATVTDNCFVDTGDITVTVTVPSANAIAATPIVTRSPIDPQTVSITGSVLVSSVQNCPALARVTVDARDDCNNHATAVSNEDEVLDATAPVATTPFVIGGNVDGACSYVVTFSSTVTDNCFVDADDVTVVVSLPSANAIMSTPSVNKAQTDLRTVTITGSVLVSDVQNCPAIVRVAVDARDDCYNYMTTTPGDGYVLDGIAPVSTAPVVNGGNVNAGCSYTVTFSAMVTDNCFVDSADVTVTVTLPTANATLGTPVVSKVQTDLRTVTITGSVAVSAVQTCPATVQVTVDARDDCYNLAVPRSNTGNVFDVTPPVLTVPANVSVNSDAGQCQVTFGSLPPATATDNCDASPTITFIRSDGQTTLTAPYSSASSPITITWKAEDNCSNTSTATQQIRVSNKNEMIVTVELQSGLDFQGPGIDLRRCITFALWNCPGTVPVATVEQTMGFDTFPGNPHLAANVHVLIPCGVYSCMTVRDRLHALRVTSPDFVDAGTHYTGSATRDRDLPGGHWLIQGNLNDDQFIDILDFGSYIVRFNTSFGFSDTDCTTPLVYSRHPDLSGDGFVTAADFTFIQVGFLDRREINCCGASGVEGGENEHPTQSISVAELWRRGMGELAAADINGDGALDTRDMDAFLDANPSLPNRSVRPWNGRRGQTGRHADSGRPLRNP